MARNNTIVIILAAGLGKRMNDLQTPKVLFKLLEKPLLAYVIDVVEKVNNFPNLNISQSLFIVGHHLEKVKTFVSEYYSKQGISHRYGFATQKEQLGTGHAVNQSRDTILQSDSKDDKILILCGDVPFLTERTVIDFINKHNAEGLDLSVLSTVAPSPKGYGRIVRNGNGEFISIVEEKDANEEQKLIREINSGIYYTDASLLYDLLSQVGNNNSQGEYYLTDIVKIARDKKVKIGAFPLAKFEELQGINTQLELQHAENELRTALL